MASKPLYDIYIRNITGVSGDRRKTMDALERCTNIVIIRQNLDSKLGFVDHLKVPEMCRNHDGTTYIAFCRMEWTDMHSEDVEFINTITFKGRKLLAKLNDIEMGAPQWLTKTILGPDGNPI